MFTVLIEKEVAKVDKDCNKSVVIISCKKKFVDNTRFMTSSLSSLVDNLAERSPKLNLKVVIAFLKIRVSRIIQENINVYLTTKIIQTSLIKN